MFLALVLGLLLVSSYGASAQVVVQGGIFLPPRPYYGPRCYYPPRPAVVYAVPPPPIFIAPQPYYAPRGYYAPRPSYGYRGRRHYGRRW